MTWTWVTCQNSGYHGVASANANGFYSYKFLEDIFLHDPKFGMYHRKTPKGDNVGCDFCLWILYIAKAGVNDNVIADTKIGPLAVEFTCTFDPNHPLKSKNCPAAVKKVHKKNVQ